nr:MAG: G protein [Jiangsu rhabdo-llike virus 1]
MMIRLIYTLLAIQGSVGDRIWRTSVTSTVRRKSDPGPNVMTITAKVCDGTPAVTLLPAKPDCTAAASSKFDQESTHVSVQVMRTDPLRPAHQAWSCQTVHHTRRCQVRMFGAHIYSEYTRVVPKHVGIPGSQIFATKEKAGKLVFGEEKDYECWWASIFDAEFEITTCVKTTILRDDSLHVVVNGETVTFGQGTDGYYKNGETFYWDFDIQNYCPYLVAAQDVCLYSSEDNRLLCPHLNALFDMSEGVFLSQACYRDQKRSQKFMLTKGGHILGILAPDELFHANSSNLLEHYETPLGLGDAERAFHQQELADYTAKELRSLARSVCSNTQGLWETAMALVPLDATRAVRILLHNEMLVAKYSNGQVFIRECYHKEVAVDIKDIALCTGGIQTPVGAVSFLDSVLMDANLTECVTADRKSFLMTKNRTHIWVYTFNKLELMEKPTLGVYAPRDFTASETPLTRMYTLRDLQTDQFARMSSLDMQRALSRSLDHQESATSTASLVDLRTLGDTVNGIEKGLASVIMVGLLLLALYITIRISICACKLRRPPARRVYESYAMSQLR